MSSGEVRSGLGDEQLVEMLRLMFRIRRFEEKLARLFKRGKLPGFVHLYIGEEAVAVGACSALKREDRITSTHRGHGRVIAKGAEVRRMMLLLSGGSSRSSRSKRRSPPRRTSTIRWCCTTHRGRSRWCLRPLGSLVGV